MLPVPVKFSRGQVKTKSFDVIFLIAYFNGDLCLPHIIVNIHYEDILSGFVVAFRYSVLSHIPHPIFIHAIDYTPAHIF